MVNIIEQHYQEALSKYPGLQPPVSFEKGWNITGYLEVIDKNGYVWEKYEVLIKCPTSYPTELPILIETGGKIEKTEDWHNLNSCCLGTDAKLYRELSDGITLTRWLDRHALPYLANHVYRKEKGKYANGEFSHGEAGMLEYYTKMWELETLQEVIDRICLVIAIKKPGLNSPCFCGSSKLYKRCYVLNPKEHFMDIPKHAYEKDLKLFRTYAARLDIGRK